MKKKTYVFDPNTLEILESLKGELGKKEVQILREALALYRDKVRGVKESLSKVENLSSKMDMVLVRLFELLNKVEDSNAKLSRIEHLLSQR